MGIRGRRGLFKLGPWDALVMKEVAFESGPGEQKWNVFPQWLSGKAFACNAGKSGSIVGQKDPLKKDMATHSSIFAEKIPWTEEPGGLYTVHGAAKSGIQLSDSTTVLWKD